MILKNKIKSVTFSIYKSNCYIGSCVIFKHKLSLFAITAGHNIHGKKFDNFEYNAFTIESNYHPEHSFTIKKVLEDKAFVDENDLSIVELQTSNLDQISLPEIIFNKPIVNPKIISQSYIRPGFSGSHTFMKPLIFSDEIKKYISSFEIPPHYIDNHTEEMYGADALGGISGGGIFAENADNNLILQGIILKVPNDGIGSTIHSADITLCTLLDDEFEVNNLNFSTDQKNIRHNAKVLKELKDKIWVHNWLENPDNSDYKDNLTRKLKIIYPDIDVSACIEIQLSLILIGESYIYDVVNTNTDFSNEYEMAERMARLDDLDFKVESSDIAKSKFNEIRKSRFNSLHNDLKEYESKIYNIQKLAYYDIANWLKICHLNFRYVDND